ncbi:uncharacterized protein LOC123203296 [Mangifera indica]|uniref:uncharacterized protein LOC123203296 n=1 Tax=Mangifera indica TaxID=29780 RepID=UPI001CF9FF49|nr:uncharacterized protein LOC123203296 [Mangifera indica]
MTANKEGNISATSRDSQSAPECCMCGDFGLSNELFRCKICQFRSQHRYCSNLYPKAESYEICNWCLSQKEDKEKSQNSSNSSSSNKTNSEDSKNKRRNSNSVNHGGLKATQRSNLQLQIKKPIKKQNSPERSPSTRKRIITNGALEEKLRRTRSEEITNNRVITKPLYRNKVRRYKLLDEVSS